MHDPDVPGDLEPLAERLSSMSWPSVDVELRGRVLQAVAREQTRRRGLPTWGAYAAGLAAAVLVMLNLTLQAANQRASLPAAARAARGERVQQLQEMLPELSPQEIQALTF
jgi:hypothetical protein